MYWYQLMFGTRNWDLSIEGLNSSICDGLFMGGLRHDLQRFRVASLTPCLLNGYIDGKTVYI